MPVMTCTKNGKEGFKYGESGSCFIGPDAKEKAEAVGKAIKANDLNITIDKSAGFKANIDQHSGFLTAEVTLARTGVQQYYGFELGLLDRALELIGVYRPPEEVFHPESVKSFANLVVTDDHPKDFVSVKNVKKLQMGSVSDVKKKDEAHLGGLVTITDAKQIIKAKDGKNEVSVGYHRDLVPEVGEDSGKKYEFVMRNIRANHLAIVDAGRCGAACKLTLDSKKESNMFKVTLDGITFDTENEQLAQAINKFVSDAEKEKKEIIKEKDEEIEKEKEEKEKAIKEKDAAIAKVDVMSNDKLSGEALDALVTQRAELIADATLVIGKDKLPACGNCPKKIKSAVIDHLIPDMKTEGKSDTYIDASYDLAMIQYRKASKSIDKLTVDLLNLDNDPDDRENARSTYVADTKARGVKQ